MKDFGTGYGGKRDKNSLREKDESAKQKAVSGTLSSSFAMQRCNLQNSFRPLWPGDCHVRVANASGWRCVAFFPSCSLNLGPFGRKVGIFT